MVPRRCGLVSQTGSPENATGAILLPESFRPQPWRVDSVAPSAVRQIVVIPDALSLRLMANSVVLITITMRARDVQPLAKMGHIFAVSHM